MICKARVRKCVIYDLPRCKGPLHGVPQPEEGREGAGVLPLLLLSLLRPPSSLPHRGHRPCEGRGREGEAALAEPDVVVLGGAALAGVVRALAEPE